MDMYWIWLTLINGVGPVTQKRLLEHFQTPDNIFTASLKELESIPQLHRNVISQIQNKSFLEKAKRIEDKVQAHNIKLLTINDPEYPPNFKDVRNFPVLLYYCSNPSLPLQHGGVGIVGSRRCTSYGKKVTTDAAEFLSKHKVPVISGLAKGIDGYAHTICLKTGGYTIAFVAHGLDICYPSEQNVLMEKIIYNGAVISEYPPGVRPLKNYFPRRNHLISAWIDKLLVVEAAERSGALITSHMAQKLGKEVYAVPNSIFQDESKGTNRLIQDGAIIYLTPEQLLPANPKNITYPENQIQKSRRTKTVTVSPGISSLDGIKKIIYQTLETPKLPEELLALVQGDFVKLTNILSTMELEGYIKILPGNLISR